MAIAPLQKSSVGDRLGYDEIAREAIVPHPLIHYSGDAILMVKEIPT